MHNLAISSLEAKRVNQPNNILQKLKQSCLLPVQQKWIKALECFRATEESTADKPR